jgi:murein DD-endopeptidase MepM/ murein hydrolase activator NlpD
MRYPLDMDKVSNVHSGMVYNLNCFRNNRDEYGYQKGGAWALRKGKLIYGDDIWDGKIDPAVFPSYKTAGIDDNTWHGAIDIVARGGELLTVYAIAAGVVVGKATSDTLGQAITIRHSAGGKTFFVTYQHIVRTKVFSIGDKVKGGDVLGHLYPFHEGVHLHMETLDMTGTLWEVTTLHPRRWNTFYMEYKKGKRPTSQFGESYLNNCGITYPCFVYNGIMVCQSFIESGL